MTPGSPAGSPRPRGRWPRLLLHGLNASVKGNAKAFGYSITITATFGAVSAVERSPTLVDVVAFALAAVAAFSVLDLLDAYVVRSADRTSETVQGQLLGTATDLLAVGAAIGVAIGVGRLVHGHPAWWAAPFVATVVYVLVQSVELAVGREAEGDGEGDDEDDRGGDSEGDPGPQSAA